MMHSILLLGQSNMAGRGNPADVLPIENDDKCIQVFRNGRWRKLYTPVNPDRVTAGVNLAESFADAYRKDHPEVSKIGLIGCADGGSSILQWQKGLLLYDYAVSCGKLAQRTSNIVAVLWHQGEGDCEDDRVGQYAKLLTAFMRNLRADLALTDVPFLIGGLGDYLAEFREADGTISSLARHYRTVNEILRSVAQSEPLCGFVPATGLQDGGDRLHFDAKSLRTFGLRYYDAFRSLEERNRVWSEKPTPEELEGSAETRIAEL